MSAKSLLVSLHGEPVQIPPGAVHETLRRHLLALGHPIVLALDDSVFSVPSRISSTWGGSLVDMVRATRILEIIEHDRLLQNTTLRGAELRCGLEALSARVPDVTNARGLGALCAIDLPSTRLRNQVLKRCFAERLIVLACGQRSLRLRPFLCVDSESVAECLIRLERAVRGVLSVAA